MHSRDDLRVYENTMIQTNTVMESDGMPKLSKDYKRKQLLKPTWKRQQKFSGEGLPSAAIIPSDPKALSD